jgi:hypothetical protein
MGLNINILFLKIHTQTPPFHLAFEQVEETLLKKYGTFICIRNVLSYFRFKLKITTQTKLVY